MCTDVDIFQGRERVTSLKCKHKQGINEHRREVVKTKATENRLFTQDSILIEYFLPKAIHAEGNNADN